MLSETEIIYRSKTSLRRTAVVGWGAMSTMMRGSELEGRSTTGSDLRMDFSSPDDILRTTTAASTSRGWPVLNDAGRLRTYQLYPVYHRC